jgi:hypothetical protein
MQKALLSLLLIAASVFIFSFTSKSDPGDEIKITVQADKPTAFDMLLNGKTIKGLTTPYETTAIHKESRFIFKSTDPNSKLKVHFEKTNKKMSADFEGVVAVILLTDQGISTFGMD